MTHQTLMENLRNYLEGVEWNGPKDEFYEHAVKTRSQYDEQYRAMATEILAARQAIRLALDVLTGQEGASPSPRAEGSRMTVTLPDDVSIKMLENENANLQRRLSISESQVASLREALAVIHTAARGDAKGECWTIRNWLDKQDIFNDDIQGSDRLIEEACRAALGEPPEGTEPAAQPPLCAACQGCGWCEGSPAFTCPACKGTGEEPWIQRQARIEDGGVVSAGGMVSDLAAKAEGTDRGRTPDPDGSGA